MVVVARRDQESSVNRIDLGTLAGSETEVVARMAQLKRALIRAGFPSPLKESPTAVVQTSAEGGVAVLTAVESAADPGPFYRLPNWDFQVLTFGGSSDAIVALREEGFSILRPFTDSELQDLTDLNPAVAAAASSEVWDLAFQETHLLVRDHLLLERLNLFRGLRSLGFLPTKCWVIPKPDRTKYKQRVIAQLSSEGYNILPEDWAPADLSPILQGAPKLLVVDDGGELIRSVLKVRSHQMQAIETTSKGMQLLKADGLASMVVDLANSETKQSMSRPIAVSCVRAFLEMLPHHRIEGARCHIVGFGKLGTEVALILRGFGVDITTSEPDATRRAAAIALGFPSFSSAHDALSQLPHSYILACSGKQSISKRDADLLVGAAVISSASSQDLVRLLTELPEPSLKTPIGRVYDVPEGHLLILGDGHAMNLFRSEGVPEPDFDPYMAELLQEIVRASSVLGRP